jgi:hypothetical protein
MKREEIIKWSIKNPEYVTEFIQRLLVQVELKTALEQAVKKQTAIKNDN